MAPTLVAAVSVASLLVAVVALALATVANRRWARRGAPRPAGDRASGPAATVNGPVVDPTALRHVAVVRYDAFADVGGRLSYSVAILDDTASGLVLTTLAGKSDVRTYVRAVSAGGADDSLTAEEQQAIEAAVGSRP